MKKAYVLCACLLLLWTSTHAQNNPCNDAGGTIIDTMHPSAVLEVQGSNVVINWDVIVNRTSQGFVDYRVDVTSIRFAGDDAAVNGTSTLTLFDIIDRTTVAQGVAKGHTPCPVSCETPASARVTQLGCVLRLGSGVGTMFQPCPDPGCCSRLYTVCCPNGATAPVITLISAEGPNCSGMGACQATCP
jgi:hypothetical protein